MSQSNGCLKTTMKFLAGFLALLVILSLPISILIFDVSRVVFSPEILSEQLTTQLIESGILQSFVTDQLTSHDFLEKMGSGDNNFIQMLVNLSPSDRETLVGILLPPDWLKTQIGGVFHALSVWFDNEEPLPKLVLDLRPLKDRLTMGGAEEIIQMIVDSWPSCTPEQIEQLSQAALRTDEVPILYCEPPEPFREQLMGFATEMMMKFIREIPPEFAFGEEETPPQQTVENMAAKEWIRLVRTLSRVAWLVPVALLGLIMALAIRSWSEFGRWWGIPLLLSGIIIFGYVLLMPIALDYMLPRLLSDIRFEAEPVYEMARIVVDGLGEVIRGFLMFHALLIGGIGLVLLVVGWLIGRRAALAKPKPPMERSFSAIRDTPADEGSSSAYIPPPPPLPPMPEDEIPIEGPKE
jgi:hypothetical protein